MNFEEVINQAENFHSVGDALEHLVKERNTSISALGKEIFGQAVSNPTLYLIQKKKIRLSLEMAEKLAKLTLPWGYSYSFWVFLQAKEDVLAFRQRQLEPA